MAKLLPSRYSSRLRRRWPSFCPAAATYSGFLRLLFLAIGHRRTGRHERCGHRQRKSHQRLFRASSDIARRSTCRRHFKSGQSISGSSRREGLAAFYREQHRRHGFCQPHRDGHRRQSHSHVAVGAYRSAERRFATFTQQLCPHRLPDRARRTSGRTASSSPGARCSASAPLRCKSCEESCRSHLATRRFETCRNRCAGSNERRSLNRRKNALDRLYNSSRL